MAIFFKTPVEFRRWLKRNDAEARELVLAFHKKDSGRPSMTWPQSVDEALCDPLFFQAQPPGYRKLMTWRIMSAKREATRLQRLEQLIADSAQERRS